MSWWGHSWLAWAQWIFCYGNGSHPYESQPPRKIGLVFTTTLCSSNGSVLSSTSLCLGTSEVSVHHQCWFVDCWLKGGCQISWANTVVQQTPYCHKPVLDEPPSSPVWAHYGLSMPTAPVHNHCWVHNSLLYCNPTQQVVIWTNLQHALIANIYICYCKTLFHVNN